MIFIIQILSNKGKKQMTKGFFIKKYLRTFFALLFFAAGLCIYAGCSHVHKLTYIMEKTATCTTSGNWSHYACACGKKFADENCAFEISEGRETIPATGHSYGSTTTNKVSTCTEEGSQTRTCSVCGYVENSKTPPIGHDFAQFVTTIESSCENNGVKKHVCNTCGFEEESPILPLGHTYGNLLVTLEPTCKNSGTKQAICSRCNNKKIEEIPMLTTHTFENWNITKAATCIEYGQKTTSCSVCGTTKTQQIEFAEHTFGKWNITKAATCTEYGQKTSSCSVCEEPQVQKIDLIPHTYGEWTNTKTATCTTEGQQKRVCSVCNNENFEAINTISHTISTNWSSDSTNHFKTCSSCSNKFETTAHTYGSQTSLEGNLEKSCTVCNYKQFIGEETLIEAYGSGTLSDPFLIYNGKQFEDIFEGFGYAYDKVDRLESQGKQINLKLMKDITIECSGYNTNYAYRYTFDGNNKKITSPVINVFPPISGEIKDLTIEINMKRYSGVKYMCSKLTDSGIISNVTLQGLDNYAYPNTGYACDNYGTIKNCNNRLNASIGEDNKVTSTGAIAQYNYGSIINCNNYGNITTSYTSKSLAGLVYANYGIITNCNNYGNIEYRNGTYSGWFVGLVAIVGKGSEITNCNNYGKISSKGIVRGTLFGTIEVYPSDSNDIKKSFKVEGCKYLQNSSINTDMDWIGNRDKYVNNSTIKLLTDEYITTNLPNFKIPIAVTEIPS